MGTSGGGTNQNFCRVAYIKWGGPCDSLFACNISLPTLPFPLSQQGCLLINQLVILDFLITCIYLGNTVIKIILSKEHQMLRKNLSFNSLWSARSKLRVLHSHTMTFIGCGPTTTTSAQHKPQFVLETA